MRDLTLLVLGGLVGTALIVGVGVAIVGIVARLIRRLVKRSGALTSPIHNVPSRKASPRATARARIERRRWEALDARQKQSTRPPARRRRRRRAPRLFDQDRRST